MHDGGIVTPACIGGAGAPAHTWPGTAACTPGVSARTQRGCVTNVHSVPACSSATNTFVSQLYPDNHPFKAERAPGVPGTGRLT